MHMNLLRSTLALAVLAAAVPAVAQNREHQQMSAELRMLQEQTQQLALTLAQIGDALKALNGRLDAADQEAQKRFADQKLLIQKLSDDVSAVRERSQDTDTRLRKLADEVEALRSTITSLPSLISGAGPSRIAGPSGGERSQCTGRSPTADAGVHHWAIPVAHAGHGQERLLLRVVRKRRERLRLAVANLPHQ